ncbi:MAG: hypothetical protein AVDCRST_MAG56-4150 [uncultured Cytophagales bacterium]|uniref:Uncharacterized protein n=1 Tax=uncultured Cytophagales bacterium TaxID=158755 RepID=A0A6J4JSL5_9SPHI|nr:MAG: hypothetical protein AVDCRST_MAG56-4150 [uncultured Cytophagales bacterium]
MAGPGKRSLFVHDQMGLVRNNGLWYSAIGVKYNCRFSRLFRKILILYYQKLVQSRHVALQPL